MIIFGVFTKVLNHFDQEDSYVVFSFTVISHLGLEVVYSLQLF